MPMLSRRSFIAGSSAVTLALALRESGFAATGNPYRDAIVIDGLGGFGNSTGEDDAPLADAFIQDVRDSGATCVHVTIMPVGTTPPDAAFTQAVLGIGDYEAEIDRHPEVL